MDFPAWSLTNVFFFRWIASGRGARWFIGWNDPKLTTSFHSMLPITIERRGSSPVIRNRRFPFNRRPRRNDFGNECLSRNDHKELRDRKYLDPQKSGLTRAITIQPNVIWLRRWTRPFMHSRRTFPSFIGENRSALLHMARAYGQTVKKEGAEMTKQRDK